MPVIESELAKCQDIIQVSRESGRLRKVGIIFGKKGN